MGGMALVAAFVASTVRASAKIDAGDLTGAKLRTKTFVATSEGNLGGSVKCPKGTRILTGGAYWHQPGKGPSISDDFEELGYSGPLGGKRWYAGGRSHGPSRFTIAVRCLSKRKLSGLKVKTATLDPADAGPVGGYLACPTGMRALSGGAVWRPRGAPPKPSLADRGLFASSTVTSDDRGWYADGTDNYIGDDQVFTISVRCLEASKLADTNLRDKVIHDVGHDVTGGFAVRCKHKSRALTGGGFWHPAGGGPDPSGSAAIFAESNAAVNGGRAWFAEGFNFFTPDPTRDLTVQALCLKRG